MRSHPKVFSIPAGAPFLDVLADALIAGHLGTLPEPRDDPLALADVTILLPTRRAVRALRDLLVERLGGQAAILPVIRPIGDTSEEDHLLDPTTDTVADRLALPPAIDRLQRQLALTELTLAWGRAVRGNREVLAIHEDEPLLIPASAADAARLAADLARLMDDVETAAIPWEAIRSLAPEDHAGYFQITLEFLKIAFEQWPEMLAERGLVDPAARRDRLIRAEAERLVRSPPQGPVIAAGSTGTIPATAALLAAIATAAEWRGGAAGPRPRPRCGRLCGDRRARYAGPHPRPSAVRPQAADRRPRRHSRGQSSRCATCRRPWRSATGSPRRRFVPPRPPTAGLPSAPPPPSRGRSRRRLPVSA